MVTEELTIRPYEYVCFVDTRESIGTNRIGILCPHCSSCRRGIHQILPEDSRVLRTCDPHFIVGE